MSPRDDHARLPMVDALLRHTVRSVLFPDLGHHSSSDWHKEASQQPTTHPVQQGESVVTPDANVTETVELPFIVGQHHGHVMSYLSWSDEQLSEEKRKLKRYLRQLQAQPAATHTADVMEAYALLKLFRSERARRDRKPFVAGAGPGEISLPLLHAQLLLYSKYFEETRRRKIVHEDDVLPIRTMYHYFLETSART